VTQIARRGTELKPTSPMIVPRNSPINEIRRYKTGMRNKPGGQGALQYSDQDSDQVEISIQKLALKGFESTDQYRIGMAVENELTKLFSDQGTPLLLTKNQRISQLGIATFEISPTMKPKAIGTRIANEVYRGFNE
jgi:hypothetical protein